MKARVAAIVLAAGASRRMGRTKPLLSAGPGTLLAAAVAPPLEAGLDPVIVVLGHEAETVLREAGLPADPRLRVVTNAAWEEGMASSLACGLRACGETEAEAAVVALGDQPGVTADRVRALVAAWTPETPLVVPVVSPGRAGHPVLFARALWPELLALTGDQGGREVVRRHWARAVLVPAPPLFDLDTPEDYRAFRQGEPPGGQGLELPADSLLPKHESKG